MFKIAASATLLVLALIAVNLLQLMPVLLPPPALPVTALPAAGIAWGAYDPAGGLSSESGLDIEQIYAPWNPERTAALRADVRAVRERHRVPLVAVEPWPFVWDGMASETLLADVAAGRYDQPIRTVCTELGGAAPQPVLVRWGHEMDLVGRFPWATDDPQAFIGAYRHFVATCRSTGATNLSFVWSPGGDPSLGAYWPGSDYVDYSGMTGLGFGAWDVWRGADRPNSFREIFAPRYALIEGFGKPVLLCEFASTGPVDHQRRWIQDAAATFADFPLLVGVVYFNAVDPVSWGEIGVPDWRITPDMFPPATVAQGPVAAPAAPAAPGAPRA
jgi:endoglucanase